MCRILPYTQCIINDNIGVMVIHTIDYVYYIAQTACLLKIRFLVADLKTVKSKNLTHMRQVHWNLPNVIPLNNHL